jgi:Cdc6-like AAA superfamily ATPase
VLQPEFIPEEVAHRDAEVNDLSRTLDPLTDDESPETPLLLGPSGTGKTCIARFTVDRLREAVLELEYQYVNCWQDYTRFRLLYRLLDGFGQTLDIHRRSTPKDELLDRLHTYDGKPYVVILDEVDQLESTDSSTTSIESVASTRSSSPIGKRTCSPDSTIAFGVGSRVRFAFSSTSTGPKN